MTTTQKYDEEKKSPKTNQIIVNITPIIKPKLLLGTVANIYFDGTHLLYTFEGRSLYFSKDQQIPIISLPHNTLKMTLLKYEEKKYIFSLSSANKLEYYDSLPSNNKSSSFSFNAFFQPDFSYAKHCVNRNVVKIQKLEEKLYYMFKKGDIYFINICYNDGQRWAGKTIMSGITGNHIDFFATSGGCYYTIDKQLHSISGVDFHINADYIHQYQDMFFIAEESENFLHIKLYRHLKDLISTISIPIQNHIEFNANKDIVICTESNVLYIFKIFENCISLLSRINLEDKILCFDFSYNENVIDLVLLAPQFCQNRRLVIAANSSDNLNKKALSPMKSNLKDNKDNTSLKNNEPQNNMKEKNDTTLPESVSSSCVLEDSNTTSISKQISLLSLEDFKSKPLASKPKNNLLEEVRAMLNKRKQASQSNDVSSPSEKENGNFEVPVIQENSFIKEVSETAESKQKTQINHQTSKICSKENSETYSNRSTKKDDNLTGEEMTNETCHEKSSTNLEFKVAPPVYLDKEEAVKNNSDLSKGLEKSKFPDSFFINSRSSSSPGKKLFVLENITEHENLSTSEISEDLNKQDKIDLNEKRFDIKQLEPLLVRFNNIANKLEKSINILASKTEIKTEKMEETLKSLIVKTLIPCVETSFNEMRIQMNSEIKKLFANNVQASNNSKFNLIQKFMNTGKINQALAEFNKLDEAECCQCINILSNYSIENADSNLLITFMERIFNFLKKNPKDVHFKLIQSALVDVEVNQLSVENLQALTVFLRYLKQIIDFDIEKYSELNCIVDILLRKIKRRIKGGSTVKVSQ